MAFTFGAYHHIGIPTADENLDRVKDFYTRIVGGEATLDTRLPNGHRMIFIQKGPALIEFYTGEERGRLKGVIDHLCFEVTDIEGLAKSLKEEGYDLEEPIFQRDKDGNVEAAFQFVYGPAGEYIELYQNER